MSRTIGIMVSVVVSLLLLSTMTIAQAAAKNSENDKSKQQHSRLSKVAFWRHHQDADKNSKKAKTTQASPKQATTKTAQVKPVAAKQVAEKKDPKPEQHASKVTKPATKKAPAAKKTEPAKATDPKQDSKAGLLKH